MAIFGYILIYKGFKMIFKSLSHFIAATAVLGGVFSALSAKPALAGGYIFPAQTCASTTNFITTHYSRITILVNEGDVLTITDGVDQRQPATMRPLPGGTKVDAPGSFTVPNGITSVYFDANSSTPVISCAKPTGSDGATTGSTISAGSQIAAAGNGVFNNAQNRLNGGGSNFATRNTVFLSTKNMPGAASQLGNPDWNAWISAEGRNYNGGFDGSSADVVLGLDKLISSNVIVGGMLAYGRTDIQDATQRTQVTSLASGAYLASRLRGDLFLDGFITYARPDYTVGANSFTATRTAVSLSLSGSYSGGSYLVTPFGKLSGYREAQPAYAAVAANDITSFNASLGAKVEPLAPMANGMLPYISLAADYGSKTSTVNGTQSFTSPRVGLGFGMATGGGYLSVDLDAGRVQSDVRDVGLRATYEFSF
jgi:hypothetical protein